MRQRIDNTAVYGEKRIKLIGGTYPFCFGIQFERDQIPLKGEFVPGADNFKIGNVILFNYFGIRPL